MFLNRGVFQAFLFQNRNFQFCLYMGTLRFFHFRHGKHSLFAFFSFIMVLLSRFINLFCIAKVFEIQMGRHNRTGSGD